MQLDVFNGDADGIIALLQLRLADPKESIRITGVKRDINLLARVLDTVDLATISQVTVLDISYEKNQQALQTLLAKDIAVFYVDHHRSGNISTHPKLNTLINTDANVCTSLLVNDYLSGKYPFWAIAAAFGDNLIARAQAFAKQQGLSVTQTAQLRELGTYINYNGYGRTVDDLHFHPARLFELLLNYENPFDLIREKNSLFTQLKTAYQQDMTKAKSADIVYENSHCQIIKLSDHAWARRVSGVFGNYLANQAPDKAHAILTLNNEGSYTVSVRAPLNNKQGADELCSKFLSGGGRAAAAGINQLPQKDLAAFIKTMSEYYTN